METNDFADTLATLAANAAFNFNLDAPSWAARKPDTMEVNGHKVHAYFVPCSGRNRFKSWGSVRWYLNDKVVSRANLLKALQAPPVVDIDLIVATYTAFTSLEELLNAKGGYFPSFDVSKHLIKRMADAYDAAQAARGDSRRAFRY